MANFAVIQNEKLRDLIIRSESINSLPEDKRQQMIDKIALLQEAGVNAMIAILEQEQAKISAAKLAKGITPEIEHQQMQKKIVEVVAIKREFETGVRVELERVDREETLKAAEDLLRNL